MAETLMSQDFQCFILVASDRIWIAKTFNLCRFPEFFASFLQNPSKQLSRIRQFPPKFGISRQLRGSPPSSYLTSPLTSSKAHPVSFPGRLLRLIRIPNFSKIFALRLPISRVSPFISLLIPSPIFLEPLILRARSVRRIRGSRKIGKNVDLGKVQGRAMKRSSIALPCTRQSKNPFFQKRGALRRASGKMGFCPDRLYQ